MSDRDDDVVTILAGVIAIAEDLTTVAELMAGDGDVDRQYPDAVRKAAESLMAAALAAIACEAKPR